MKPMNDKVFFGTNILTYSYSNSELDKHGQRINNKLTILNPFQ